MFNVIVTPKGKTVLKHSLDNLPRDTVVGTKGLQVSHSWGRGWGPTHKKDLFKARKASLEAKR